jgi:hypothetical protein
MTGCQARTRLYRDGKLELEGFPVADISDYLADKSVTVWLDLLDPDHDDIAVLSEEFGLHPLAVEAALHHGQRPRLHRYPSHLFLITVRQDDGLDIGAVVQRWDETPDLAKFGVGTCCTDCWTTWSTASSRRYRAWMTAWRSWKTGCSTTLRGAWRSSGAASSCARAWCCCAGS